MSRIRDRGRSSTTPAADFCGKVRVRVRKAQTVSASSSTSDSRVAMRQPISFG